MPPEVLLTIFAHLGPRDLLRLSQIHSSLHQMAFDPSLWVHLHPIRWANGHLNFFTPTNFSLLSSERYDRESSDDSKEEGIMMYMMLLLRMIL